MNGSMNLNKQESLDATPKSKGALIFAVNNSTIDYLALARINARLIEHFLGLPTTIVTDRPSVSNTRTFRWHDQTQTIEWHNTNRFDALEYSPYDQTLLLDADYLILSNTYSSVIAQDVDFLCHRHAVDITNTNTFSSDQYLSKNSDFPMYWATAVWFSKNSKPVFDLWRDVHKHYDFYSALYGFEHRPYRNDRAMSVALHTLNGMTQHIPTIPWSIPSLGTTDRVLRVDPDTTVVFDYATHWRDQPIRDTNFVKNTDVHVMNKSAITPQLIQELEAVIND